jgi:hypothetical protein
MNSLFNIAVLGLVGAGMVAAQAPEGAPGAVRYLLMVPVLYINAASLFT